MDSDSETATNTDNSQETGSWITTLEELGEPHSEEPTGVDLAQAVTFLAVGIGSWALQAWTSGSTLGTVVALSISVTFVSLGTSAMADFLPENQGVRILRALLQLPAMLIIGAALLIVRPLILIYFLMVLLLSMFAGAGWLADMYLIPEHLDLASAYTYLCFTATLLLVAYGAERVLLPATRWLGKALRTFPEEDEITFGVIRWIMSFNYRKWVYIAAILFYLVATVENLTETNLGQQYLGITDWSTLHKVSVESLLTFLAIDAYVANFHGAPDDTDSA